MVTVGDNLGEKKSKNEKKIYYCKKCDYNCTVKYNWLRHLLTRKHIQVTSSDNEVTQNDENELHQYCCKNCGKKYVSRNGIWKHNKKCFKQEQYYLDDKNIYTTSKSDNIIISQDILLEFIKQNNELKEMLAINTTNLIEQNNKLIDMAKEGKTINNNTQNNFNLNVFLNETCKDAMNISDFIDSIKVELEDLEITGQIGYAAGLSRIFINNLNDLHVHKRPIHCSNLRNEVLYIKNDGEWIKEDDKRTHITNALKHIGHKHMQQIYNWQKKYPDFSVPSSKHNDKYNKLICNVMSGSTIEEQSKNINKIIKNVIKHAVIDKK